MAGRDGGPEGVGLTRRDPGLQRPQGGLLQLHRRGEALGEHRVVLVLGTAAGMGPADALPEPLGERAGGGLLGLDEDLHRRMAGRLGPERAGALEDLLRALVPPGRGQHQRLLG